jgi:hypothetical protein
VFTHWSTRRFGLYRVITFEPDISAVHAESNLQPPKDLFVSNYDKPYFTMLELTVTFTIML